MTRRNTKLVVVILFSLLLPLAQPGSVFALPTTDEPNIVINELQANGVGTGTTDEEFIELKNIGANSVDISGWKLQYISSTGNIATAKYFITFPAQTILYPGGYLLITPNDFLPEVTPKITYAITSSFSGLAASGGTVALVNAINVAVDMVGWGTKDSILKEGALAVPPADGASIQRVVMEGATIDTDNNYTDFTALSASTPQVDNSNPAPDPVEGPPAPDNPPITETPPNDTTETPPVDEQPPIPIEPVVPDPEIVPESYQPILLNELFIDPASPLTDSNDEWVELYNPNATAQNLAGYTVYAGSTFAYHHTLTTSDIIAPNGYFVISSGDTAIALANGGGAVKIVGPSGVIYDSTSYEVAKEAMAWAKNGLGGWQWTTTPTEAATNTITTPTVATALVASAAKKATSKKTTVSTKSTTAKKATVAKSTSKTTKVLAATDTADAMLVAAPTPLPLWLLAVLGVLAVLYSGYEYRFDIANKLYQLRKH